MSITAWDQRAIAPSAIVGRLSNGLLPRALDVDEQVRRVARYVHVAGQLVSHAPGRYARTGLKVVADPLETTEGSLLLAESADECLVSLCGEYDNAKSNELSEAIGMGASRRVIIDLAHATFIDASVIGVLMRHACRRGALNDSRLRIIGSNTHFRKIFDICNLAGLLDIVDSAK
jgi:anti-anti-sigma factor